MAAYYDLGSYAVVVDSGSTQKLWMPFFGIPVGAVFWSAATVVINAAQVAELEMPAHLVFFFVLAGGLTQAAAVWIGFSAILWAMVRAFRGQVGLLLILREMSATSWPLWFGVPAMAFWLSGEQYQTFSIVLISLAGLLGFFVLMGRALAREIGWTNPRGFAVVATAVIFISSFIYLAP